LAAWVHNSLTESFLTANQAYGRRVLSPAEADAFVREQMAVGRLLDADPLPDTAGKLRQWVAQHPDVAPSPGMADTVEFLQAPPLDPAIRAVYRTLAGGAAAIIPPRLTATLGVSAGPSAIVTGRLVTAALRWAIGQSPRWRMALLRVGAPVPEELFKQKVPFEELRRRR
jgi:hypothetical protein